MQTRDICVAPLYMPTPNTTAVLARGREGGEGTQKGGSCKTALEGAPAGGGGLGQEGVLQALWAPPAIARDCVSGDALRPVLD